MRSWPLILALLLLGVGYISWSDTRQYDRIQALEGKVSTLQTEVARLTDRTSCRIVAGPFSDTTEILKAASEYSDAYIIPMFDDLENRIYMVFMDCGDGGRYANRLSP